MRSYTVAIASLAILAPTRWTDNILSQFEIPDVISERRGVARKLPHSAVVRLAIVRQLHMEMGIGVREALHLTMELLRPGADGVFETGQLRLGVDRAGVERMVNERLGHALESTPIRPRGRPPGKARI